MGQPLREIGLGWLQDCQCDLSGLPGQIGDKFKSSSPGVKAAVLLMGAYAGWKAYERWGR
jgi:hypothetical protein